MQMHHISWKGANLSTFVHLANEVLVRFLVGKFRGSQRFFVNKCNLNHTFGVSGFRIWRHKLSIYIDFPFIEMGSLKTLLYKKRCWDAIKKCLNLCLFPLQLTHVFWGVGLLRVHKFLRRFIIILNFIYLRAKKGLPLKFIFIQPHKRKRGVRL